MKTIPFVRRLNLWSAGHWHDAVSTELRLNTALLDRLGPPNHQDDIDGWLELYGMPPSPGRCWLLEATCGLQFVVSQEWFHAEGIIDHAFVRASTTEEVRHALLHLPFEGECVWSSSDHQLKNGWRVQRADEAGVRHDVATYPFEASARCVAQQFEDRGHKQTYFVEAVGTPPSQGPGVWAVRRQDENGQVFTVEAHPFRGVAEAHAEWMASSPLRRQLYWVELAPPQ